MRFVDRFGNEIDRCISFDTNAGIAVVYEPEDGLGGSGPLIKQEKYHPEGMAVVDDIARPDEQQLGDIREKKTGKREREK
jgi:hypothetical protein